MTNQPNQDPSQASEDSGIRSAVGGLLFLFGVTLLLPGLCTMALAIGGGGILTALACLAISAVGLWLVVVGLRIAYGWSR